MIKALSWTKKGQNLYAIEAFADTKAEVDAGDPIVGIPDSYEIEMGSSVMTADGEKLLSGNRTVLGIGSGITSKRGC